MQKFLLFLCGLVTIISVKVFSQFSSDVHFPGEWSETDTLPYPSLYAASAWLNDTLYIHTPTGNSGIPSDIILKYTLNRTWSQGTPLPDTLTGGVLTKCGERIYYVGGSPAGVNYAGSTLYEYTPSSGGWTAKDTLPVPVSGHTALNWGDSVIYVLGGPWTGSKDNLDIHFYRISTGKWETIPNSLPVGQGRRTFASGISGNKIIISCGYNSAYLKSTLIGTLGSDATQLSWERVSDLPVSYALSRPGGTAFEDLFFLIGGEKSGSMGVTDSSHVYSFSAGEWFGVITGKPVRTSNIFNSVSSKVINDSLKIFVTGGYNGSAVNAFDILGSGSLILPSTSVIDGSLPDNFLVLQNYPNPFNPVTTISYNLPAVNYVSLKVYDTIGNEVAVLVNEIQNAGRYHYNFNAGNLASGSYICRITTGGLTASIKLLLLK